MADHETIDHPERMVGDHDHRPCGRDRLQLLAVTVDAELELTHGGVPEALAEPRSPLVLEIKPLEAALTGEALDRQDRDPPQRRIVGACIAEQQPIRH